MALSQILRITDPILKDEGVQEYEYHEYEPVTGANLNNPGELRINIETQDLFTHPSESYILVEGKLTKADGTAYADANAVTLTNNAIMHLFSNIKYQLSGQEIESVNHPGQATTMLGLLKYSDDFSKSQGLNQLWYKDTHATASLDNNVGFNARQSLVIKTPNPKGSFSFRIPLKHIFGFCEDYDKIVYGLKHTLTLVRKAGSDDAIFRANGIGAGKVTLEKLSWFVPHIMPADVERHQLYSTIESKTKLDVGYRMRQCETISVPQTKSFTWRLSVKSSPEKPRFVIVGFQTAKGGDQEKNPSTFDNVGVRNMYVMLNSTRYPAVDYNLSFAKCQISRVYGDAASFRSKFYRMDELVSNPNITPLEYMSLYPLFVFDVSHQSEKLKSSVIDIQVKANFDNNVAANTDAYAMVISDRIISLQSNGDKMSVVI